HEQPVEGAQGQIPHEPSFLSQSFYCHIHPQVVTAPSARRRSVAKYRIDVRREDAGRAAAHGIRNARTAPPHPVSRPDDTRPAPPLFPDRSGTPYATLPCMTRLRVALLIAAIGVLTATCARNPVTGERQLALVSEA